MKIQQKLWTSETGWQDIRGEARVDAHIVFVFGARSVLAGEGKYNEIRHMYPNSHVLLCSTAGEILDTRVRDGSIALTAVAFDKTTLQGVQTYIDRPEESHEVGKKLGQELPHEHLVHVLVFSDGLKVNGTGLVSGLGTTLPANVSVTGGLVGDGAEFKETLVGFDQAPAPNRVVAIGLYSETLRVGYGSLGGWDPFGPPRKITKASGNVLYELDSKPALDLYKEYLGEKAKELPASGLLFPLSLSIVREKGTVEVVRTVLAVNEEEKSMTFAGDMPEGVMAKLMKANFDRLIDGAEGAAKMGAEQVGSGQAELAILVSCIGRKLVLKDRIEEEIEAVRRVVGEAAAITGFYSYGELCPTAASEKQCELHNQTMTITTLQE